MMYKNAMTCCANLLLICAIGVLFVQCQDDDDEQPQPADSYEELDEQGYLIHGLKDMEGISKNLLYLDQFDVDLSIPESVLEQYRELGFSENFRAIPDVDVFRNLGIELVELIPWPDANGGDHPVDDLLGGDPLAPGLPSRGSLVSDSDEVIISCIQPYTDGSKGKVVEVMHLNSDGGSTSIVTRTWPNGSMVVEKWIFDGNENNTHRSRAFYDKDGNLVDEEVSGDDHTPDDTPAPSNPLGDDEDREELASGDEPTEDDAGTEEPEDEEVAGFQPIDGEGVYCPMTIDYCRRAAQQIIDGANPESLKLGFIRINPPRDAQPGPGPRLRYDPNDLVINPDPNANDSDGRLPSGVQIVLPVLINPPGPNERLGEDN